MGRSSSLRHLCLLLATWLLAGLLGATLVRYAPGFGTDEREMDSRFSQSSLDSLEKEQQEQRDVLRFYWRYLSGLAHGDFGQSRVYSRPVRELLADRLPVTMRAAGLGLLAGWAAALALAMPGLLRKHAGYSIGTTVISTGLLSVPTALMAVLFFLFDWPAWAALAAVVFPRIFRYVRNILVQHAGAPSVLQARAAGVREPRILLRYVLRPAAPELLAVAGVSASLAFSAAIPVEALCDVPGVGSLAWQAALGRDFSLLLNVTMLVALIVLASNAVAELATLSLRRKPA